jgi:hypothetical protein
MEGYHTIRDHVRVLLLRENLHIKLYLTKSTLKNLLLLSSHLALLFLSSSTSQFPLYAEVLTSKPLESPITVHHTSEAAHTLPALTLDHSPHTSYIPAASNSPQKSFKMASYNKAPVQIV